MSNIQKDEAVAEIERRSRNFERFFREKNAEALVADYYVEDEPRMSAPGIPTLKSHKEITDLFASLMEQAEACDLFHHEVRVSGEYAFELGGAKLTWQPGVEADGDCRYLIVWRKVPDGWRVETDFFAYGNQG